jgi:hypothetical protein
MFINISLDAHRVFLYPDPSKVVVQVMAFFTRSTTPSARAGSELIRAQSLLREVSDKGLIQYGWLQPKLFKPVSSGETVK